MGTHGDPVTASLVEALRFDSFAERSWIAQARIARSNLSRAECGRTLLALNKAVTDC